MAFIAIVATVIGGSLLFSQGLGPRDGTAESSSGSALVELATTISTETALAPYVDAPPRPDPVRIRIPRIEVDAPVIPVGLTVEGAMEAPERPEEAGWYEPGVRPGELGSAVIAGHSGYRARSAVFDDLPQLREGDRIYIEDDTGGTQVFVVRETREYPRDARAEEVFLPDGGRHLNLITCAGQWNRALGTNTLRLVVFAEGLPELIAGANRVRLLPR